MVFVGVRLAYTCPECGGPVPLNRVAADVFCHHCLSSLDAGDAWPANLLGRCWDEPPTAWEIGKRRRSIHLKLSVKPEVERLGTLPAGLSVRATDAFTDSVFPGVLRLHGEVEAVIRGAMTAASQPLLFACLGCGAGLKVDGSARVVACDYCHESCFLPDDLWLRMHPVTRRRWLVLEYPEARESTPAP
ncbi:MAG: hypothetical protein NT062_06975 [Proteobacteria bacterium]|nr:hypothetical protein [Pseudomonadota bacterium]